MLTSVKSGAHETISRLPATHLPGERKVFAQASAHQRVAHQMRLI